jgi:hypothetical protein
MTQEWTEEVLGDVDGFGLYRRYDGSSWGDNPAFFVADSVYGSGGAFPTLNFASNGMRIAAIVPSSGTLWGFAVGIVATLPRRRRIT